MRQISRWLLSIVLFAGMVQGVLAVGNNGISVSPPFFDVQIGDKDLQKDFILEVGNHSEVPLTISLGVVDFGSLDESGGVAFLNSNKETGDRKYALASWMSLEKDVILIEPGKKEKVKVTILNKESLISGGHYGAVLATIKNDEKTGKDLVGLSESLASLVYVQKTGGEKKNLVFKSLDFAKNIMHLPLQMKVRFENSGNVHLVPRGKIEVINFKGDIVLRGIINENSGKIFPETFRVFNTPLKANRVWLWPGKYKIDVNYRYDGKETFDVYKTSYVYLGKEGVILMTIFVLAIGFFVAWKRRH